MADDTAGQPLPLTTAGRLFLLLAEIARLVAADDAAVARIDAAVTAWRDEVVRPLRSARRHLKHPAAAFDDNATAGLRSEIKRNELAAERIQQLTLERMFPAALTGSPTTSIADAARANLDAYSRLRGSLPTTAVTQFLDLFNAQS